jgi:hypothetical protein
MQPEKMGWFRLLDWSVYHSPVACEWQETREWLNSHTVEERPRLLREWKAEQDAIERTPDERLAIIVAVANYCRSHRGQFRRVPAFRVVLDSFNEELYLRWEAKPS